MRTRDARVIRVLKVDAFTSKPFSGNPAGVVLRDGEGLNDGQMQAVAREMNLSETAFLLPATTSEADLRIRWFTPTTEVSLCGHATVAAFHAATEQGEWGFGGEPGRRDRSERSVRVECRSGILPIRVQRDEQGAEVRMGLPRPEVSVLEDPSTALQALGIAPAAQGPHLLPALVGPPYILIQVQSLKALRDLAPDMESIRQVSAAAGGDGLIAASLETFDVGSAVHVRMFAPAAGIDEDPVTGSAQALVAAWLARRGFFDEEAAAAPDPPRFQDSGDGRITYVAEQGEFTGRPGRIGVEVRLAEEDGRSRVLEVNIAGRAVTVMQGEMAIPMR